MLQKGISSYRNIRNLLLLIFSFSTSYNIKPTALRYRIQNDVYYELQSRALFIDSYTTTVLCGNTEQKVKNLSI